MFKRPGKNTVAQTSPPQGKRTAGSIDPPGEQTSKRAAGSSAMAVAVAAQSVRSERADEIVSIAAAAIFCGDIAGKADVVISGRVEGTVDVPDNDVTIAETGDTRGGILVAHNVTVRGTVQGDVQARGKVTVFATGRLEGTITAPRLEIEAGAKLKGRIDIAGAPAAPPVDLKKT